MNAPDNGVLIVLTCHLSNPSGGFGTGWSTGRERLNKFRPCLGSDGQKAKGDSRPKIPQRGGMVRHSHHLQLVWQEYEEAIGSRRGKGCPIILLTKQIAIWTNILHRSGAPHLPLMHRNTPYYHQIARSYKIDSDDASRKAENRKPKQALCHTKQV